jgi:hypothetical protein
MSDKIEIGDIVSVHSHGGQTTIAFKAEVLYTPVATGDSWRFRDVETGDIHYVSEGCTISKKVST